MREFETPTSGRNVFCSRTQDKIQDHWLQGNKNEK